MSNEGQTTRKPIRIEELDVAGASIQQNPNRFVKHRNKPDLYRGMAWTAKKKAHSELVRRTARIAASMVNARQVHQGHRIISAGVYLFWDILFNIAAFD
jgi:hypothetical protein